MDEKLKFIILSTQRSGSTYLELLLNSYRSIRCHGEVFLRDYYAKDGFREYMKRSLSSTLIYILHNNPLFKKINQPAYYNNFIPKYLEKLFTDPEHSNAWYEMENWNQFIPNEHFDYEEAVGFKLMYDQLLINERLEKFIKENNVKIIHLVRRNKLKQFLSYRRMKVQGKAHTTDEVKKTKKIHLKIPVFQAYLEQAKKLENHYSLIFDDVAKLKVWYEEINDRLDDMLNFLAIEDQDTRIHEVRLQKISKGSLSEQIENYEEIERFCLNNGYHEFID